MNLACSTALRAAVLLDIPDALADAPSTTEELAGQLGLHPGMLEQLLRALSRHGVFSEVEKGCFAHTDLSLLLRKDEPGNMRMIVLWATAPWTWKSQGATAALCSW
jgi:C-methyltransferase